MFTELNASCSFDAVPWQTLLPICEVAVNDQYGAFANKGRQSMERAWIFDMDFENCRYPGTHETGCKANCHLRQECSLSM